jgi:hypothetical protein
MNCVRRGPIAPHDPSHNPIDLLDGFHFGLQPFVGRIRMRSQS